MINKILEMVVSMESGVFPVGGTVVAAIFMAVIYTM